MALDSESLQTLRYDGTTSERIRLVADDGTQYLLEVTDALRGAVRRLDALTTKLAQEMETELRPRDIQALIRSGVGPEELALAAGLDPEVVWRYAQPVLDERAWIAQRAQDLAVSTDDDAPLLGELALDRLATRGVSPDSMTWDAVRDHGRWTVSLAYSSGDGDAEARWAVDLARHHLEALDDQAAWISETVMPDGPIPFDPTRPLAALDGGIDADAGPDESPGLTLLDELMNTRGLRQPLEPPEPTAPQPTAPVLLEAVPAPAEPEPPSSVSEDRQPAQPPAPEPTSGADILHLLPPLEAEDTRPPLYAQLALGDADDVAPNPAERSESSTDGRRVGRRSILDRRHEVEGEIPKPARPPASSLEEDAAVGVEDPPEESSDPPGSATNPPDAEVSVGDPAPPADAESLGRPRRGRRRSARHPFGGETSRQVGPATAGPSADSSSTAVDSPAGAGMAAGPRPSGAAAPQTRSAVTTTPAAAPAPAPVAGSSHPSSAQTAAPGAPLTAAPASSAASGKGGAPPPQVAAPTEVVTLLPLDETDFGAHGARKAKPPDEPKQRPRSRRSSVPSWDEIVFGAKPER